MNCGLKRLIIATVAIGTTITVSAQSTGELLRFSRYDFSNTTARSAAMAGAYTSMGSDLSSMSINPAGLGMYTSHEVAITAGANIGATRSTYGESASMLDSRAKFIIPNFGGAFKLGNFTLGIGMNRLADFNSKMSVTGDYENYNSMTRIWADQITGIPASQFSKESSMFNRNPVLWNGVMGYDSYLIDPANSDPSNTTYGVWGIVDPSDRIASSIDMITNGAIDEFSISGAWDFDRIIFVGMTMGFQSIYYNQSSTYREQNDLQNPKISGVLNDFGLQQNLNMSGFGFNLKVGITARPFPWLRIGVAYHSPTWSSMRELSYSELSPNLDDGSGRFSYTPDLLQDYDFQTPGRLLAGVSATIAKRLIVSFDYERTWYADMFYNTSIYLGGWREGVLPNDIDNLNNYAKHTPNKWQMDINGMVAENYRATSTYRVGIEVQPVNQFFIRGGFSYSESPYSDKVESFYAPGTKLSDYGAITRYSGGLGYRSGRFNIDAAYVYSTWSELPSKFFDYVTVNNYNTLTNGIIPAGTTIASKSNIKRTRESHNIMVTFSWRF